MGAAPGGGLRVGMARLQPRQGARSVTLPRPIAGLVLLQVAAFWPVWSWYVRRTADGSDEPWGLAALVVAGVLLAKLPASGAPSVRAGMIATIAYALAYPFVPSPL